MFILSQVHIKPLLGGHRHGKHLQLVKGLYLLNPVVFALNQCALRVRYMHDRICAMLYLRNIYIIRIKGLAIATKTCIINSYNRFIYICAWFGIQNSF